MKILPWVFIVLPAIMLGCATPKKIDRVIQADYSNDLRQMRSRMDSLLYNMRLIQKETNERLSNLKLKNKTVYLSPPDSTGKQYTTAISNTTASKEEKENISTDSKIETTVRELIAEIHELKQQSKATISENEKVVKTSWWQSFFERSWKLAWLSFGLCLLWTQRQRLWSWMKKILNRCKSIFCV